MRLRMVITIKAIPMTISCATSNFIYIRKNSFKIPGFLRIFVYNFSSTRFFQDCKFLTTLTKENKKKMFKISKRAQNLLKVF